ncbi:MAG: response regulator [Spirochaetia bacterium]|nr:response regulator [Spirochaetia bacterium]
MKTILIADDSSTARMVLGRCLEMAGLDGATFLQAPNGEEALALCEKVEVDLIVTDLHMPKMDGEKLLCTLKASPKLKHIPVVLVTSALREDLARRLVEEGALSTLAKPVSPSRFREALSAHSFFRENAT